MISLSVVKIRLKDSSYRIARKELEQVRDLLHGIQTGDPRRADTRLAEVLKQKHQFSNRRQYTLFLDTIKVGDVFYVWSTRHVLTAQESEHISKLLGCAMSSPNSLLVFPDYIMISMEPPPDSKSTTPVPVRPKKRAAKPKTKNTKRRKKKQ